MKKKFKYIYGPVNSWRLGRSLGIDPVSGKKKICSFDCVYCQLGRTQVFRRERDVYVTKEDLLKEIKSLPPVNLDYVTFSGNAEPTLAKNLGELIKAVRTVRKEPVAVLTNASLFNKKDVRKDLCLADFVAAKLDASRGALFEKMNRPAEGIKFGDVLIGIKRFREEFDGRLALQMMFIGENKNAVDEFIRLANSIRPDEIEINTPLRPCGVKPLSKPAIAAIKEKFIAGIGAGPGGKKIEIISVYDHAYHEKAIPISTEETLRRRGKKSRI